MQSTRVLILGANGSQGRRYTAIVRYLGMIPICVDLNNQMLLDDPQSIDAGYAIIATPIDQHKAGIRYCCQHQIPFLCEKPIVKDSRKVEELARLCSEYRTMGFMVNNWAFARPFNVPYPNKANILFDFYNTGNDGDWDLIQPIYYANILVVHRDSPFFRCSIDGWPVTLNDFCVSYIKMVAAFFSFQKDILISIEDSIAAHQKVEQYIKDSQDAK